MDKKRDKPKQKRSKSSGAWLERQRQDPHTQAAKKAGYRSRAAYKLMGLQEKDPLCKPGMIVIDLGAAPGGWSQVLKTWVGPAGKVIALDILPIVPLSGVDIIEGDFQDEAVYQKLLDYVGLQSVEGVYSDMAPNFSGIAAVDQARAVYLGELALAFAERVLKVGGFLVIKQFQGAGFESLLGSLRSRFESVSIRKPSASRAKSREVYLVAKRLKH